MTNERIARATANVSNGRATTSSLVYESGKNRSSLVPGNDYTIKATYQQNNNYKQQIGTATLKMLKCSTTTSISGNTNVSYGESVILTITVLENKNHTLLNRGTVSIYDGNECIQSNYTITGNSTTISFIPSTIGNHDIYAIYNDSGVEYNSSNSNHLTVTVSKLTSTLTVNTNTIVTNVGESVTISGTLSNPNGTLSGQNIDLIRELTNSYDVIQTVTTDNNGNFTLTYSPNLNYDHGKHIVVRYVGTSTQEGTSQIINVYIRHETNLSVADETGFIGNSVNLTALAVDENDADVTEGTIDWMIFKELPIELDIDDWTYAKMEGTSVPDEDLITPSIIDGELSTGRGNIIYYNTPITLFDLSEWTLRCRIRGTMQYNRFAITTVTENNNDTLSMDYEGFNSLTGIINTVSIADDTTSFDVEFKFLDWICYIFVDGEYTGISYDYGDVDDDLYFVMYSNRGPSWGNRPIILESMSYVNCVDLNGIPSIPIYEYGLGTDNPFNSSMWYNGGLSNAGYYYVNYRCNPAIFKHKLSGDFTIRVYMSIDCYANPGEFGFTTSSTGVNRDHDRLSYESDTLAQYEGSDITRYTELIFERSGTTYTVYRNNEVYATLQGSNSDVYFYMSKNGSCSIYTGKIVLEEEFNGE